MDSDCSTFFFYSFSHYLFVCHVRRTKVFDHMKIKSVFIDWLIDFTEKKPWLFQTDGHQPCIARSFSHKKFKIQRYVEPEKLVECDASAVLRILFLHYCTIAKQSSETGKNDNMQQLRKTFRSHSTHTTPLVLSLVISNSLHIYFNNEQS